MSEIKKTETIVLNKFNYGDTSSIVTLFSADDGKFNVIVKGARSPKSKYGKIIDPVNHLQIVYYKKESRDLQLLTSAEIIDHYPGIKSDLERIKYAYAIIELVKNLLAEHEANQKLFKGLIRILTRLDAPNENPGITFGRFFIFFLKEIGYGVQIENCTVCKENFFSGKSVYYNFDKGLICGKCRKEAVENYDINPELLQYLRCLKDNVTIENLNSSVIRKANLFLEQHLIYHVPDFKGIQSLKYF